LLVQEQMVLAVCNDPRVLPIQVTGNATRRMIPGHTYRKLDL
jgi:hypothetical protein